MGSAGADPSRKHLPWMRAIRRELHQVPELANEERRTREIIAGRLREIGLTPVLPPRSTAVIATVAPDRPGPAVALRADMDGLPLTEETGLPFASETPGRMHACGHDLHMAALLGAARRLLERDPPAGPVRLLFQ
ncbi:MAG: M20/M25/M40 family metallo-hydrolase, partial [Thermoplasmata archaeon]